MKIHFKSVVTGVVTLILAAGISFAADVKTPDVKGAVKATSADAKKGVADTKGAAKTTVDDSKKSAADAKTAAKKIVDINSATEAELKSIPGIGDAYAAKIVAGRPYANKAQLKSRNIVPSTVYEQTKDLLIAKQPKADPKAPAKQK